MVKGERVSQRKFLVPIEEEVYLRRNWPFLSEMRNALRTEPNVRLALLFGSFARGTSRQDSDVDLMVETKTGSSVGYRQLSMRIRGRVNKDVQIVPRESAESSAPLMVNIIEEGRVLVDRGHRWPELRDSLGKWQRKAGKGEISGDIMESWVHGG
ncbi:MAG: nucleotidyltransferase domain-containing protein [Thermoleophilia bacterium]|nr:nucleotidyltransferase domain-containing protein [Thermoleophilia bacterium]